jgi:hypothetical protein
MSIIKSGTTNTTAYSVDANTNGDLVFIVSESLTAMTISASGAVSLPTSSLTITSGATLNGGVVVNELGADVDFRVEGDTDANLLFVDASTDRVGMGIATPAEKLHLFGSSTATSPRILVQSHDTANATAGLLLYGRNASNVNFVSEIATSGQDLIFKTNNTTKATLSSAGNLGLDVTPSAWGSTWKALQISNWVSLGAETSSTGECTLLQNAYASGASTFNYIGSFAATRYTLENSAHKWYTAPSGTAGNTITFTQAMTLDASGNLGVGTATPTAFGAGYKTIQVAGTSGAGVFQATSTNVDLRVQADDVGPYAMINVNSNHALTFRTNATERARITAGGYAKFSNNGTYFSPTGNIHEFINTTNNEYTLYVRSKAADTFQYGMGIVTDNDQNNTINFFLSCLGSATERATIRSNGGLANYSANNVNLASDERLKKDIAPLDSTWSKVKGMEVVNFRYKDCHEDDPALYGVIAQQVQPIVPELVVVTREATETDPEYYGIREQPMYWLAIKALQEAMTRIEALEAEVAALKGAN